MTALDEASKRDDLEFGSASLLVMESAGNILQALSADADGRGRGAACGAGRPAAGSVTVVTTIIEEEVTCAVCGMTQTVQEMGSTSSFGAMDLDTRPPELRRSTMDLWVHECGECGYVAPELETAMDGAGRIVASADYRAELKSADRVRLANRMVCRSLLDAATGDLVDGGLAAVARGVGWTTRRQWRRRACSGSRRSRCSNEARAKGQRAMKSVEGGDEVLLGGHCATRSGMFERALATAMRGCAHHVPAFVRRFSSSNGGWCWRGTRPCHTVGEVVGRRPRRVAGLRPQRRTVH